MNFARSDQRQFDRMVSKSMEPELLAQVVTQFVQPVRPVSPVRQQNRDWSQGGLRGEFDALLFHPAINVVGHVQAKATPPAEGTRMVARLEDTVHKGVEQIERFRRLELDAQTES